MLDFVLIKKKNSKHSIKCVRYSVTVFVDVQYIAHNLLKIIVALRIMS